jgi:hypothetical protein
VLIGSRPEGMETAAPAAQRPVREAEPGMADVEITDDDIPF